MSTRKALPMRVLLYVFLFAVIGLALIAGKGSGSQFVQSHRSCFPAGSWEADESKRPCAEIVRVFEDGSVRVRVTDASGRLRYVSGIGALDR